MSSSSSSTVSSFVPAYSRAQEMKILDLASPEKFNISYDQKNPDPAALADEIFIRIARNADSIKDVENKFPPTRCRASYITWAGREFPLVESERSIRGELKDPWKEDITFLNSSGESLFSHMVRRNEIRGVNKLIESSISIHTQDKKGNYPVHWVAKAQMTVDRIISSGMQLTRFKEKNCKTPGHKSASVGQNSVFVTFAFGYTARYQFAKEKHGKLRGTTWDLTPIFVALIKGHYDLVGELLSQKTNIELMARQTEPEYRNVGLFELAIELGCFSELVKHVPFKYLEEIGGDQLYFKLSETAKNCGQDEVVEYLNNIRSIVSVNKINPMDPHSQLSAFYEAYPRHQEFAKWFIAKGFNSGTTLLEFLVFQNKNNPIIIKEVVAVYEDLGIDIPKSVKNRLQPPVVEEIKTPIQNPPTGSNSLVDRIRSLACSILCKPVVVIGVVLAVVAVAALVFNFGNPFAVPLTKAVLTSGLAVA
jgi:hypothetical protein